MSPLVPLLALLALAAARPAAAQVYSVPTPYCNGRVVAAQFTTLNNTAQNRYDYAVLLTNPASGSVRFQLQVVGDMLGRPVGSTLTVSGSSPLNVSLGYSPKIPGRMPLNGQSLAQAVRITCL